MDVQEEAAGLAVSERGHAELAAAIKETQRVLLAHFERLDKQL
jgi:hypothetical protein